MNGWKKAAGILVAMNGVGSGVAIFLQTGLGGDPIGILCDGISQALSIQFGHASLLYNLVLIVLAAVVASKHTGAGSIAYALMSGYFIDFYNQLLSVFELQQKGLYVRLPVYAVGIVLFTASLAILIHFKLGMNALDAVLWKISDRSGISYVVLRLITDLVYVAAGYLLGGTLGIGTVVCILTAGTMIKRFTACYALLEMRLRIKKEVAKA